MSVVIPASQPSVATVSYQVVPMAPANRDGDEGVVAHADVEEAGGLAGQCDLGQFLRTGRGLPGLHVDGRLRLDRQLHPEHRPVRRAGR